MIRAAIICFGGSARVRCLNSGMNLNEKVTHRPNSYSLQKRNRKYYLVHSLDNVRIKLYN